MRASKEWLVSLTGLVFFVLGIVGVVVVGQTPDGKDSAREVVSFYVTNDSSVVLGAGIAVVAGTSLVFFSGYLRRVLRRAEGDDALLPSVAFVGAVIVAIAVAFDNTILFALAQTAGDIDPTGVQTLNALYSHDFLPFWLGMQVLLLAAGVSVVRSGALPRPLGWVAIILGVVAVTPIGFVSVVGGGLWIAVVSVLLTVRARSVPA
jgi:hypothetical protein